MQQFDVLDGPLGAMVLSPAVVVAVACAVCTAQEPPVDDTGKGWQVVRLDLDVRIDPAAASWTCTGRASLQLQSARSSGPTIAVRYSDFASVAAPGAVVDATSRHPRLESVRLAKVRLAEAAGRGAIVDVDFATRLRESASQLHVDAEIALASWTMAWYPFPLPDESEGFSASHSRAPGTIRFHLPEGWRAVSDGTRTELRESGNGTIEAWSAREPIARSFAAGPYRVATHRAGQREVAVYVLGRNADSVEEQARSLGAAIAAMEDRFGPFPSESYAIAEIPMGKVQFYGASQQGFLMAVSSAFRYGRNLPLFAHEAAHAWWGNAVGTLGPGGILCSESLAQYGAVLAIEALEGRDAAIEFLRFSRRGYSPMQCARGYFRMQWRGQDKPLSQLGSGGWQHDLSDAKGHWVFHMLRRRLGDRLFFETLRGLLDAHRGGSMSLDDLRRAFLTAAPADTGLERFFAQWLDRTGAPELECTWLANRTGGVDVRIAQRQNGKAFDLHLDVALHLNDGSVARHGVHLTDRDRVFTLAADRPVREVKLDPEHDLLLWMPEYGPAPHTMGEDPALDPAARARYLGVYAVEPSRVLEIVARGDRISLRRGGVDLPLRHLGGHRFRSESGFLEFVLEQEAVLAIEYAGDDGRRERAAKTGNGP